MKRFIGRLALALVLGWALISSFTDAAALQQERTWRHTAEVEATLTTSRANTLATMVTERTTPTIPEYCWQMLGAC